MKIRGVAISLLLVAGPAQAGEVEVVTAEVQPTGGGLYRFDVTLRHGDTGWDHYADRWEVLGPDGMVLGTRVLYHPHVDEQPFTRSLSDVPIAGDVREVTVRGHDSEHEYGGSERIVPVPR